jgi:hypothetical protein
MFDNKSESHRWGEASLRKPLTLRLSREGDTGGRLQKYLEGVRLVNFPQ